MTREQTPEESLSQRRMAVTKLGASLRAAIAASAVSDVPVAQLAEASALADRLAAVLSARVRPTGAVSSLDDLDNGTRYFSPVSGEASPMAPPLRFEVEGDATVTRTVLDTRYEGPPGFVHGGFTAMMFDEVIGRALYISNRFGMTARLDVSYRGPVPIGVPIELRGWIVSIEGRKTRTAGTVTTVADPSTVLAEAEGLFIEPRQEKLADYFGGLVDANGEPVTAKAWGELAHD